MGTHPIFESDFDCLTEGLFFTLNKCSSEMSDWESRRTCWVGNLSDKVTEEILFELFLQIGPLEDVTKPKNKNFAFILFTHKRSTTYAVKALNNVCLFGQMIHVKFREVKRNEGSRDRMDGRLGERRDRSRTTTMTAGDGKCTREQIRGKLVEVIEEISGRTMFGRKDPQMASDGRLIVTQTVDIKTPCLTARDLHLIDEEIQDGDKFH